MKRSRIRAKEFEDTYQKCTIICICHLRSKERNSFLLSNGLMFIRLFTDRGTPANPLRKHSHNIIKNDLGYSCNNDVYTTCIT